MAVTKKILRNQITKVEGLINDYTSLESSDVEASEVAEKLEDNTTLLLAGSISWINSYRPNKEVVEILKELDSKLLMAEEGSVVLDVANRTVKFVEFCVFDKD